MAEQPKTLKIKMWHLVVVVLIIAVSSVLAFLYLTSSSSNKYVSIGNGWNYVKSNAPTMDNNLLQVDFVGIVGCQFCAIERYALFYALSNFGNWTYYGVPVTLNSLPALNITYSDEPQNDALFYKTSEGDWTINFMNPNLRYSSNKIDFITRETANNQGQPLQQMTPYESQYLNNYDPLGYVPFTIIGGNFFEIGAGISLIKGGAPIIFAQNGSGIYPKQILTAFNLSGSEINTGITTEADYISAAICHDINDSAPICSAPAIKSIENVITSAS